MVGTGAWWWDVVNGGSWSGGFGLAISVGRWERNFVRIVVCIVIWCGVKRDGVRVIPVLW